MLPAADAPRRAGPDGEFDQPDAPHALRLDSASDGVESI